ncbi:MAG: Superoxide dismutase [Cu-Zn] [uncultured bacterium]|nr:MAG: Superoxide dismutase [Cu-Zn] [uncultured bacterium]
MGTYPASIIELFPTKVRYTGNNVGKGRPSKISFLKDLSMKTCLSVLCFMLSTGAIADVTVNMYTTTEKGQGQFVGTVTISESPYGLLLTPHLSHLPPTLHGFHVHQMPSCADNGMAAGGHLDPKHTEKHLGPYNDKGHLGDLPALYVTHDGSATLPVVAPRIKNVAQLKGHSLMIHDGGDNYSDTPEKLGGGGKRMACGVIP